MSAKQQMEGAQSRGSGQAKTAQLFGVVGILAIAATAAFGYFTGTHNMVGYAVGAACLLLACIFGALFGRSVNSAYGHAQNL